MTSELFPKYFRIFRNDIMFSGMALDTMPKQQQTMSELLVYKASAGSGKTFTLAVEYIKLLMANPRAYRQILAVTFTNKATAEMKERILSQLYGLSVDDKESQAYLNRIVEDTGMEPAAVRQAAGVALGYLLHDYSQFRVETIDSIFQSVMRNLARELELSPNLNIELNIKKVLSGMGFGPETYQKSVAVLSGGEHTRLCLARLLFQRPDVLILLFLLRQLLKNE